MVEYKGYKIENERGHVKVTPPIVSEREGIWREDTVEDAKQEIDERICVKYWRAQEVER